MAGEAGCARLEAALASRDMRLLAAFLWMIPLDAALSSVRKAAWTTGLVEAGSPWATASRAFFTADLMPVRTWTFLVRRFWACRLRFSAERMFANVTLRNRELKAALSTARRARSQVIREG